MAVLQCKGLGRKRLLFEHYERKCVFFLLVSSGGFI